MQQRDHDSSSSNESSGGLMSSLMKSWRGSSSSSSHNNNNNNNTNIETSNNISNVPSPLQYSSSNEKPKPSMFNSNSNINANNSNNTRNSNHVFRDLDEDWSAVIDDYNMPIPMIANGGTVSSESIVPSIPPLQDINNSDTNLISNKMFDLDLNSQAPIRSLSNNIDSGLQYPQLPTLNSINSEPTTGNKLTVQTTNNTEDGTINSSHHRIEKFDSILKDKNIINQQDLRELAWNGIPDAKRPLIWKLLIGYLPANTRRQQALLARKRKEYSDGLSHIFSNTHSRDEKTWHQIEIDIPRTNQRIQLYQFDSVQSSLQKILYLWAIRHPASGYVQGINDIVTPFYQTFLTEYLPIDKINEVENLDPKDYMTEDQITYLEADTFWCLTKLLEQITDNYIHGQPGILKQVKNLSQLVKRIDSKLYNHFQKEHVEFIQFAFRWMNCLLMREFQMKAVIRMWDTYLAETSIDTTVNSNPSANDSSILPRTPLQQTVPSFRSPQQDFTSPSSQGHQQNNKSLSRQKHSPLNEFHVFVCAAFLIKWSDKLIKMDFQNIITFLQNPPTKDWSENDIDMLLGEAYIWQSLYKDATSHWL